jgi:hypothetical protein
MKILTDWQKNIVLINELFTELGLNAAIDVDSSQNMDLQTAFCPVGTQNVYWLSRRAVSLQELFTEKYRYDGIFQYKYGSLALKNRWILRASDVLFIIENPETIIFENDFLVENEQNHSPFLQRLQPSSSGGEY